jgi:serine/threonine protein kinase
MNDNAKLTELIEQIPEIRKRFKRDSRGTVIYKDPEFIAWKNKVLVELERRPTTQSVEYIRKKFSKMGGWSDETDFEEIISRMLAMVESEGTVDMVERVKLKKGVEVITAFNRFTLKEQVGAGGNGKVWSATDKDGEEVAIKFLERDNSEKVLKRFKNETFFCIKHEHPNILPILDYGTAGTDYIFYVMPLYAGTLRDYIKEGIKYDDISKIFTGILRGLKYAHKSGAIHRDIKPENILFAKDSLEPVIADFGIAHFSVENLATVIETKRTDRMANFQYAAPEQRKKGGIALPQTDIYAAALILNEMFTGEIAQASDYKKIGEIAPQYSYLDELFVKMYRQEPNERLYPEEVILTEMQALADKQENEDEVKRLRNLAISVQKPEDYNPEVIAIKYESGNLLFELDQPINTDWFQRITSDTYSHTAMMGYETNRLQKFGENMLAMPIRLNASQETIRNVVKYVKEWVDITNGIYKNAVLQQMEREQRAEEQQRLEKIKQLEKENEMRDFLSSLQ